MHKIICILVSVLRQNTLIVTGSLFLDIPSSNSWVVGITFQDPAFPNIVPNVGSESSAFSKSGFTGFFQPLHEVVDSLSYSNIAETSGHDQRVTIAWVARGMWSLTTILGLQWQGSFKLSNYSSPSLIRKLRLVQIFWRVVNHKMKRRMICQEIYARRHLPWFCCCCCCCWGVLGKAVSSYQQACQSNA